MFSTVKCNSFSQVWILDNNFMNIISLWICGEETNLYFGNKGRTASLLLEDNVTCIHNVFYKNCKNSIVLVCYSSIYMSLICKRVAKYVMCVDVMAYIMHGGWAGRSRSLRELQCGSWVTELWALCQTNPYITFPISLSSSSNVSIPPSVSFFRTLPLLSKVSEATATLGPRYNPQYGPDYRQNVFIPGSTATLMANPQQQVPQQALPPPKALPPVEAPKAAQTPASKKKPTKKDKK